MNKGMARPCVLLISSVDPHVGPAKVALDYYRAFVQCGIDINFLTKYPVEGYPDIKYVYKKPRRLYNKLIGWFYTITGLKKTKPGHCFFYTYEFLPQVPVSHVLAAINRKYDLVLVLFWQGMLSFSTIKGIYNKLHCQIHFMGVDYSQMSGGCHFTCDCTHFQTGCGMCPGIYSQKQKDFTYYNIKYRKDIYNVVKPVVYGNLYMRQYFYRSSFLLRDARVEPSFDIYDLEEFYPMDKKQLRSRYRIPDYKKFIIFIGCQDLNDPRKGMNYLLNSLRIFWNRLKTDDRNAIILIIAGRKVDKIEDQLYFDYRYVGYLPSSKMPEMYSMADVYLSPSVDDAGPSMVNQSLCCGTPVVAFEMGTALESIKDRNTGYCAKLRDVGDFAKGIEYIYNLSLSNRRKLQEECRAYAVNHFSYSARVNNILEIYNRYSII